MKHLVAITGLPGSGKSTVCSKLVELYGCQHISAGLLLRQTKDPAILNTINKGELVPDKVMCDLLVEAINKCNDNDCKFILLDGFPRSNNNLEYFEEHVQKIDLIINLNIDEHTIIERLLKRQEGRNDDELNVITKRIQVYNTNTKQINSDALIHVDTCNLCVDNVVNNCCALLEGLLNN